MTKYPVILQASMSSRRFPGKVLAPLLGKEMVRHVVSRALRAQRVSVVVATVPGEPADHRLLACLQRLAIHKTYLGFGTKSLTLFQYLVLLREVRDLFMVRLTADNPLVDPDLIDAAIALAEESRASITTTRNDRFPYAGEYPPGYDVEVINRSHLLSLFSTQSKIEVYPSDVEHVTPLLYRYGGVARLTKPAETPVPVHVTVDYPHDLALVERILRECGVNAGYQEVVEWHARNSGLSAASSSETV